MSTLRIGPDWAQQIRTLRDAITEDTNLIRFDNAFYRICRAGADILVRIQPSSGAGGIDLQMQARDLYVARIDGKPFERYASTLDTMTRDFGGLDHAVQALPRATGTELFELQSLLVFCVGESLRSDEVATAIEQAIRASTHALRGVAPRLPMARLLRIARSWGQGSDAIFAAMSPEARALVLRPRSSFTAAERQFSERIDLAKIDPALHDAAKAIKVLKRPA